LDHSGIEQNEDRYSQLFPPPTALRGINNAVRARTDDIWRLDGYSVFVFNRTLLRSLVFECLNDLLSSSGDSINNSNHELLTSQIGLTRQCRFEWQYD